MTLRLSLSISMIGRELKRNCGADGYKPDQADRIARARKLRGHLLEHHRQLRACVVARLGMVWTPEQISGRLQLEGSQHTLSPESIYRYVYSPHGRKDKLHQYLAQRKAKRGYRRCDRRLGCVELGASDLGIGIDEGLLIDPADALHGVDIERVLRAQIAGMSRFDLAAGFIVLGFLLKSCHLAVGQDLPLLRILTDRGTENYGKAESHDYQLYLAINDIDHTKTKAKSPQTNGICERFHKTVLQDFYQIAFRKTLFETIDDLQKELDLWIDHYNHERTHQGKMCCGRTPMETLIDGKQVWLDKKIDRT